MAHSHAGIYKVDNVIVVGVFQHFVGCSGITEARSDVGSLKINVEPGG